MQFTIGDQEAFAQLSGDWNPVHVDPVFARRSVAGRAVVHGIHLLVWALDTAARDGHAAGPVASVKAKFSGFVTIGEEVEVSVSQADASRLRVNIVSGSRVRSEFIVGLGEPLTEVAQPDPDARRYEPVREAIVCDPDAIAGMAGIVPSATPAAAWEERFPDAARWLGGERLAALGASTRLVGMICPGMHSFYLGLTIKTCAPTPGDDLLGFEMGEVRHGLVQAHVAGSGIKGTLDCLVRAAPAAQTAIADLAGRVAPDAFAGDEVLVVGGSRGLGEAAAKLLALGGARVTITYAAGAADAERVAGEIRSAGGACDVVGYRLGDDLGAMLDRLPAPPSHVYYFATPRIAATDSRFFDKARYAEFHAFFVDGFWDLTAAVRERRGDVRLFYPSTVYVEARPRGLGEYAMAKAAGEALCAEINAVMAPLSVVVERLPQLATDQNLTSSRVLGGDPVEPLLPLLERVHARAA